MAAGAASSEENPSSRRRKSDTRLFEPGILMMQIRKRMSNSD
jgi:hypothetical protein